MGVKRPRGRWYWDGPAAVVLFFLPSQAKTTAAESPSETDLPAASAALRGLSSARDVEIRRLGRRPGRRWRTSLSSADQGGSLC